MCGMYGEKDSTIFHTYRVSIMEEIIDRGHSWFSKLLDIYYVKVRVCASPKILSQTGIMGKMCISEARYLQIE